MTRLLFILGSSAFCTMFVYQMYQNDMVFHGHLTVGFFSYATLVFCMWAYCVKLFWHIK